MKHLISETNGHCNWIEIDNPDEHTHCYCVTLLTTDDAPVRIGRDPSGEPEVKMQMFLTKADIKKMILAIMSGLDDKI